MSIRLVDNKLKCIITNQVALRVNRNSDKIPSIWTEVAEEISAKYPRIDALKVKEIFFKEILPSLDQNNFGVSDINTLKAMKDLVRHTSKSPTNSKKSSQMATSNGSVPGHLKRSRSGINKEHSVPAKRLRPEEAVEPKKGLEIQKTPAARESKPKRTKSSRKVSDKPKTSKIKTPATAENTGEADISISEYLKMLGRGQGQETFIMIDSEEDDNVVSSTTVEDKVRELFDSAPKAVERVEMQSIPNVQDPEGFVREEIVIVEELVEAQVGPEYKAIGQDVYVFGDGVATHSELSVYFENEAADQEGINNSAYAIQVGDSVAKFADEQAYSQPKSVPETRGYVEDTCTQNWDLGRRIPSSTPLKAKPKSVLKKVKSRAKTRDVPEKTYTIDDVFALIRTVIPDFQPFDSEDESDNEKVNNRDPPAQIPQKIVQQRVWTGEEIKRMDTATLSREFGPAKR